MHTATSFQEQSTCTSTMYGAPFTILEHRYSRHYEPCIIISHRIFHGALSNLEACLTGAPHDPLASKAHVDWINNNLFDSILWPANLHDRHTCIWMLSHPWYSVHHTRIAANHSSYQLSIYAVLKPGTVQWIWNRLVIKSMVILVLQHTGARTLLKCLYLEASAEDVSLTSETGFTEYSAGLLMESRFSIILHDTHNVYLSVSLTFSAFISTESSVSCKDTQ